MPKNGTDGMPFPKRNLETDPLPPGCATVCPTCENPVDNQGITTQRRRKTGRQCPQCGFRLAKRMTQSQLDNLKPFGSEKVPAERHTEISRLGRMAAAQNAEDRKARITAVMERKAEELAEKVAAPYFAGLELEPREEWSPSTKLDFYIKQSVLADKVYNRVEGLPVARQRNVDKDDRDVLRQQRIALPVARSIILDLLEGGGVIDGEAEEEAEWEPTEGGENDHGAEAA